MVLPIGSYFSWARGAEPKPPAPTPEDRYSRRITRNLSWQQPATGDKQERYGQLVGSMRMGKKLGERPVTLSLPTRGLDGLQECVRIEDNLRRTSRHLDTCSERIDEMRDSAIHIRQELEGLQQLLATMGKKAVRRDTVHVGAEDFVIKRVGVVDDPTERPPSATPQRVESHPAQCSPVQQTMAESPQVESPPVEPIQTQQIPAQESPAESPLAQSIEPEQTFTESASYTTSAIQRSATETRIEKPPSSQSALVELNTSAESLVRISEESSRPDDAVDMDLTPTDQPRGVASSDQKTQQQQQAPRFSRTRPSQEESLVQNTTQLTPDENKHRQTPRSLRSNPVQKRFPIQSGDPLFTRVPKDTSILTPRRASLKPVLGSNKVSQMTQFWSKMDGT